MSISKIIYTCGLNRRSELVGSIEDNNLSWVISNKEIFKEIVCMYTQYVERKLNTHKHFLLKYTYSEILISVPVR